jgi:outer membrane immunogenic protein
MKVQGAAAIAALLNAGSAMAADMPVKAPPIVASTYDWTGFYEGVHFGYGVARDPITTAFSVTNTTTLVTSNTGERFRVAPAGWLGGVQGGYNWQFAPTWVAGVEVDWSWTDQHDSFVCATGCQPTERLSTQQRLEWLSTLRARLGYAHDGWLWYVTGGGAWGHVSETDYAAFGGSGIGTVDSTMGGWTAGAGVEVAVAPNWTGKFEYLYVDLGRTGPTTINTSSPGFSSFDTVAGQFRDNIVRVGLNYRMAGPTRTAEASRFFSAPPHDWTGVYLGGNAGYGVGRDRITSLLTTLSPFFPAETLRLSPAGALAGAQQGYNWQFARNWVVGAEVDGQGAWQKDSSCTDTCNFVPQVNAAGGAMSIEQRVDWLATARGRMGYAMGDWLAYLTGGAAWAGVHTNYLTNSNISVSTAQFSHTRSGWVAGAGIETALCGAWSAKLEYLYVDLGTVTDVFINTPLPGGGPPFPSAVTTTWRDQIVRFGVNYSFGYGT